MKQNKLLHNVIKPETIKENETLSFSFNPISQPLFSAIKGSKLNNFQDWYKDQLHVFKKLKYCELEIYLEISSGSRFHYHGLINIFNNNVIDFFFYDLQILKFYGSIEIDHIDDHTIWDKYVSKLNEHMNKFCKRENIPIFIKYNPLAKNTKAINEWTSDE